MSDCMKVDVEAIESIASSLRAILSEPDAEVGSGALRKLVALHKALLMAIAEDHDWHLAVTDPHFVVDVAGDEAELQLLVVCVRPGCEARYRRVFSDRANWPKVTS